MVEQKTEIKKASKNYKSLIVIGVIGILFIGYNVIVAYNFLSYSTFFTRGLTPYSVLASEEANKIIEELKTFGSIEPINNPTLDQSITSEEASQSSAKMEMQPAEFKFIKSDSSDIKLLANAIHISDAQAIEFYDSRSRSYSETVSSSIVTYRIIYANYEDQFITFTFYGNPAKRNFEFKIEKY